MLKNRMLVCLLFIGFCLNLFAQSGPPPVYRIGVKAAYVDGSTKQIRLRWVPENQETWEYGNANGYTVERITLQSATGPLTPAATTASKVVWQKNPKTQAQWETLMTTNEIAGLAASAMFGDKFTVLDQTNEGPVTAYNMVTEEENRYGLSLWAADVNTTTANYMCLWHNDATVQVGYEYLYTVYPKGDIGNAILYAGVVSRKAADPDVLPQVESFTADGGDKTALLSWSIDIGEEYYSTYEIKRRLKGQGSYLKVHSEPILPVPSAESGPMSKVVFFTDSLPDNTNEYQYIIRGQTIFGYFGPNSTSILTKGKAPGLAANVPILGVTEKTTGKLTITWEFDQSLESEIQGFNVYCSESADEVFADPPLNSSFISKSARSFVDANPKDFNYYRVEAVDKNGNAAKSQTFLGQIKDDEPPTAPTGVSGMAKGKDGTLVVTWSPSTSTDVMGYRVFMSDVQDGNFIQVTPDWVSDTFFYFKTDPRTLSEAKYFTVRALDERENPSEFSEPGAVKVADLYPPSKPLVTLAEAETDGNLLMWKLSTSQDVVAHRLMRRKVGEVEWENIYDIKSGEEELLDDIVENHVQYEYMVQAEDDAGLMSNSHFHTLKTVKTTIRPSVRDFEAKFDYSKGAVVLEWSYNNEFAINSFVVYRKIKTSVDWIEVAAVTPNQSLSAAAYQGPNPFVGANMGNGGSDGQYQSLADPSQFAQGVNFNQPGDLSVHETDYCYLDRNFTKFVEYEYSVAVRFNDGSSSKQCPSKMVKPY